MWVIQKDFSGTVKYVRVGSFLFGWTWTSNIKKATKFTSEEKTEDYVIMHEIDALVEKV